jgi:Fe2+ transport system protein B
MTENNQNTPLSTWGKMQKMLREVLVIIFGVTVSIWFANWNDKRKEQEEVKTFLTDIKQDLTEDTVAIRGKIEKLKPYIRDYRFARNLTVAQLDSIKKNKGNVYLNFDIIPLQFNEGNYQGFKSSGKIGFIENKELKKQILAYHEQIIPGLKEIEKEHLMYQKTLRNTFFNDMYSTKSAKETFLDPKIKTEINSAEQFSNFMIEISEIGIKQADTLLLSINKVLK